MDEKGFSAPYGLTTAERRHPEFRTHGVGKCECCLLYTSIFRFQVFYHIQQKLLVSIDHVTSQYRIRIPRAELSQIIHTWYRGNEGGPMAKMTTFSSWNADAVLGRYMVDGNKDVYKRQPQDR